MYEKMRRGQTPPAPGPEKVPGKKTTPLEETLRNKFFMISLSRLGGVGTLFCLGHILLITCTWVLGAIASVVVSNEGFQTLDAEGGLALIIVPLLFYAMVWIVPFGLIQIGIFSSFATDAKIYPTNKLERFLFLIGGDRCSAIVCSIIIGVTNGILMSRYMSVKLPSDSTSAKDIVEQGEHFEMCPSVVGPSSICWNEQRNAISWVIFFSSVFMFLKQYKDSEFILEFPSVNVSLNERQRIALIKAWNDCADFIIPVLALSYAWFGVQTLAFMVSPWYIQRFQQVGLLFNVKFYTQLTILVPLSMFSVKLCWRLVEFAMTAKLSLPLEPQYVATTSSKIVLLSDAMNFGPEHMMFLGFYEFGLRATMPIKLEALRQFFKLSHPGGHPRNWNGVLEATLALCDSIGGRLRDEITKIRQNKPTTVPQEVQTLTATLVQPFPEPPVGNGNVRQRAAQAQMRHLTTPFDQPPAIPTADRRPTPRQIFIYLPHLLKKMVVTFATKFWEKNVKEPLVRFGNEMHKKDFLTVLTNIISVSIQPVTWGVNGVTALACASLNHDSHGVVQKDLRRILITFVDLHQALMEIHDSPPVRQEGQRHPDKGKLLDGHLRQLTSTISYSLAKLNFSFAGYYDILGFSDMEQKKLREISKSKFPSRFPVIPIIE